MDKKVALESQLNSAKQEIEKNIDQYSNEFQNGTKTNHNFLNINDIECKLGDLLEKNKNICLDLTSKLLESIDEKGLIEFKKKSMKN